MNRTPGHDDAFERQWQLQERAMRPASGDAAPCADEGELAAYRRVARALREPPAERLPSNFAWQVAQLAARLPNTSRLDLRLERWLMRGLVTVFALGAVAATLAYGGAWLRALDSAGTHAAAWMVLLVVCVSGSWLIDAAWGWRRGAPDLRTE